MQVRKEKLIQETIQFKIPQDYSVELVKISVERILAEQEKSEKRAQQEKVEKKAEKEQERLDKIVEQKHLDRIAENERLERIAEKERLERNADNERLDRIAGGVQESLERSAEKEREFELGKIRLGIQAETNSIGYNSANIEQPREKRINLKDLVPRFNPKHIDISLFFMLLKKQATKVNVPETSWVSN